MFTRIEFVLLLCVHEWIIFSKSQECPNRCKEDCISCFTSTICPYITSTTQSPSTFDCSCPVTEAVGFPDCSKCPSTKPTTETQITTATTKPPKTTTPTTTTQITATQALPPTTMQITTTQITTTTAAAITTTAAAITTTAAAITTTKPLTISEYQEPAEQKSGLCLDNQASSPGPIIGAAIGGAIFGFFLTAIIFVYINRRSKNSFNSKDDQTSRTVRNAAYGYSNDTDQVNSVTVPVNSAYSEINDGMRKSAVISPIMRQADSTKIDGVYNHLGESDKEDRGDYYDHAGPAPSLSVMEDGYGVLSMESEDNDNYNTVDGNYSTDYGNLMTDQNKQGNDYFILETQNN